MYGRKGEDMGGWHQEKEGSGGVFSGEISKKALYEVLSRSNDEDWVIYREEGVMVRWE